MHQEYIVLFLGDQEMTCKESKKHAYLMDASSTCIYFALLVKNVEMLLCCFLVTATEQVIQMPAAFGCSSL